MNKAPDKTASKPTRDPARGSAAEPPAWASRHVRFGWWSLLAYSTLGFVLELFHGFKIGWYLDVTNETRRLMWTLAHAHGTLLALVHIALGYGASWFVADERTRRIASSCLYAAAVTLPVGFFLGGVNLYSGDPGVGVVLAPIGGFLLLAGVGAAAWGIRK